MWTESTSMYIVRRNISQLLYYHFRLDGFTINTFKDKKQIYVQKSYIAINLNT